MNEAALDLDLRDAVRTIPDYPKPGIMFRDIPTLLGNARAFRRTVAELVQPWAGSKIDKIAGIEARGFIHGDARVSGERVVRVDDLSASGGTAEAAVKLLRQLGAEVLAACFVIDLPELGGAKKLRALGVPVRTLIAFDGH